MYRWLYRLRLLPRRHVCFIFHRIHTAFDPLLNDTTVAEEFDAQLAIIKNQFRVISLEQSLHEPINGQATASISFDDGYADNLHVLVPLLEKHQLPATVFCTTAFLNGDLMWNDWLIEFMRQAEPGLLDLSHHALGMFHLGDSLVSRQQTLRHLLMQVKYWPARERMQLIHWVRQQIASPPKLMLNETELKTLSKHSLISIGGHTHEHHVLTTIENNEASWQIEHNRALLTDITGIAPTLFAFPNGKPEKDYRAEHVRLIKHAGYRAAWTTEHGAWDGNSDCFQIPRFSPWQWDRLHFTKHLWDLTSRPPLLLST